MIQAKPQFKTIDEYLNYDDGADTRYELVDGELVEMGAESPVNVATAIFLISIFLQMSIPYYLIHRGTEIAVSSRSVTTRYPDLLILSEAGWQALAGETRSFIRAEMPAPVLVIEVVSPGDENSDNYQRDYVEKPREYAARGILELWQIDPGRSVVNVLELVNGAYQSCPFSGDDLIVSPQFPNLQLTAAEILRAGQPSL